ncbi:MAG: radical SAM protein [Thermoprotei archaeon]|nr:MAG: radical SAM protein [Thermoprotei archaeon]
MSLRVCIIDGYDDEPSGLGVPPYLDIYARYTAGAIWLANPHAEILYLTVDQLRSNIGYYLKELSKFNCVIFIAGVAVPGRYLGGMPIRLDELKMWSRLLIEPVKILIGPVVTFGFGVEGGRTAILPKEIKRDFDYMFHPSFEKQVYELTLNNFKRDLKLPISERDPHFIAKVAVRGAKIVTQHPNYGFNLICEIETYWGCPRYIVGGCSFCIEPLYGKPKFRAVEDVIEEVKSLYNAGVRHIRLGRQPDLFTYQSKEVGEREFPKPNVEAIRKLFKGIRTVAPALETLHIDNVNPGTVYHHREDSIEICKTIIENHTPGDVAAFGIESADPKVVKLNNLKVYPEEALEAIRIINSVGAKRGYNGLPHLLPGVNFVYGLKGETEETYQANLDFMKEVLNEGLMVRRINIRQVMAFPNTPMWEVGDTIIKRNKKLFKIYKEKMRVEVDLPMLKKVVPTWTKLRNCYVEKHGGGGTYARQAGSYPILIFLPYRRDIREKIDVVVTSHGFRSVVGIETPININNAPRKLLKNIPGLPKSTLRLIMKKRPFKDLDEVKKLIPKDVADKLEIEV